MPSTATDRLMNTKHFLLEKRDESGRVVRYKARLVVCGNEKEYSDKERFSPLGVFTMVKWAIWLSLQKRWVSQHFDYQNSSQNGKLDRQVYAKVPKYAYTEIVRRPHVLLLHCSLSELFDMARIWNKTKGGRTAQIRFKKTLRVYFVAARWL